MQDDLDQKVTNDVQLHIGKLSYNNIVLAAQVEALQAELARAYDEANRLRSAAAGQASGGEPDDIPGEVVPE